MRVRWFVEMRKHLPMLAMLVASSALSQQRSPDATLSMLAGQRAEALLLYFVASDCPVSNRYFPEMERIAAEFAPQHVTTRYVYPNPDETSPGIARHQREFGAAPQAATLDSQDRLVAAAQVNTTPEAALLVRHGESWKPVYRGRIDDRYVRFGVERAHAEHHDLEDAVRAALAGKPVPQASGPPVGCAIVPSALVHDKAAR